MTRRLGYVAKVFPRVSETFVINELRALEDLGETPVVFSLHRNPADVQHAILRELRAPVEIVEDVDVPDTDVKRAADFLAEKLGIPREERGRYLPRKYVRLAVALSSLADRHGVRHLHAHFASRAGHVGLLAAAWSGRTSSLTAHAKDIYHRDVDRELLAWKLRRSRFAVTVTDYNLTHLLHLVGRDDAVGQARLLRLYNGIDLTRFRPRAGAAPQPPLVLAVGRLVEKKGFRVLVEACALLRARGVDFRCEIVGGGELHDTLAADIRERGVEGLVTLAGSTTTEAVAARLADATVVALPCIVGEDGNVDALPTALLEGMACTVPLVSTRLSGIPEIVIDGENGRLVEPGNAAQLAGALEEILTRPETAAAMGRAGRRRAEELFDLRRSAAVLKGMFDEACAQGDAG